MNTIFLLAMDYEISNIFDLNHWQKDDSTTYTSYFHQSKPVAIIETGVGKVNAAAAAEYALSLGAEQYVNIGLAGSFDNSLPIGSAHGIKQCKFWDIDVTALGFKLGQIPFNGLQSYAMANSNLLNSNANCISGDSFVQEVTEVQGFAEDFSASLLEMEIASLAHVFYLHGQLGKLMSIKAVSDYLNKDAAEVFSEQSAQPPFTELKKIAQKIVGMC